MPRTACAVLALDIGATKLAAAIGHTGGEVTRRADAPTHASLGAETALRRAVELARGVYEEELGAGGTLDALGVSTMGYTRETHVELAPNVPGWSQVRLPEALRQAFPKLTVAIGNDVHVAAQAEIAWGSLQGVSEGIYLNLGSGIAAAIVCNGRLVTGANGAAGEVGYSLFRGAEPRMAAEGVAPFEHWFGGAGVARRLAGTDLGGSVAELLDRRADPSARALIDELCTGIAVLAANLCTTLNPSVLSLGGGYVRGDSGVIESINELLERATPYPPKVVRARFGPDASLRGAVATGLAAIGALA